MKLLPDYQNRTYGLDIFRAIAILLVVHSHGKFMLETTLINKLSFLKTIDGVELFFVLSGFLIGGILIKIIDKNNFKLNVSEITRFWKRRWFRTLPNYYLILIINVIFVKLSFIDGDINKFGFDFIIFTQNFFKPLTGFFWESWSLSIEEWFYIILPLCIFFLLKIFPSKKGLLYSIILLMIIPLLYRILNSNQDIDGFWWDVKFRKLIMMRLDTIIYGVLAAYIKYYHKAFWNKSKRGLFIFGLILVLVIPYIPREPNDFFSKTLYFNLTTISAMLLLPLADSIKTFKTKIGKGFTHISLISYSMYLINLGLVAQVIMKHFPIQNPIDGIIKYIIYWVIVIISSTLLYKYFERPIMNLRDKY